MSISTALTEKFGLVYPIVSAPMGSVAGGRLARAASADIIVAQGTEVGGHGADDFAARPAVVDAVAPTPVLTAGGIADGRTTSAQRSMWRSPSSKPCSGTEISIGRRSGPGRGWT